MSSSNIFVRFFRAIWGGLNGLRKLLHLVLLLFIFMLFVGVMSGEAPPILPKNAALVVQPVGALVEQLSGDPYDRAIAELMGEAQPETLVQDPPPGASNTPVVAAAFEKMRVPPAA